LILFFADLMFAMKFHPTLYIFWLAGRVGLFAHK